jgi:hypothetical protein
MKKIWQSIILHMSFVTCTRECNHYLELLQQKVCDDHQYDHAISRLMSKSKITNSYMESRGNQDCQSNADAIQILLVSQRPNNT